MIIWLASYPKSGNTWIRIFLTNLLFTEEKSQLDINKKGIVQFPLRSHFANLVDNSLDLEEITNKCISAQNRINSDSKIKIFKTHSALWKQPSTGKSFTNLQNTQGIIHIVRDPRNIITSVLDYFNMKNYEEAYKFLINSDNILGGDERDNGVPTIISSWSNHYNSWKNFNKNYLLIKYEDLIKEPEREFFKITNFLTSITEFNFNKQKILKTIDACNFENFTKQEGKSGFIYNSITNKNLNKKFFRLGPKNNWQILLDSKIRQSIETSFKLEMEELEYLPN